MKIIVNSVRAKVFPNEYDEDRVCNILGNALSWYDEHAHFMPSFREGRWDGYHRLFRAGTMTFPSGLCFEVRKALKHDKIKVVVDDRREFPPHGDKIVDLAGVTLRPDQIEAVEACLKHKSGIVKMPPGTGKTEVMIALGATLGVYPLLWVTDKLHLLHQTADRFKARIPTVSVGLLSGDTQFIKGDIVVATVQSLASWVKSNPKEAAAFIQSIQVLICDEAHHQPGKIWYGIFASCPAPFRFGCSATPLDRTDKNDMKLVGSTGRVIYELTPSVAADRGVLVCPHVFMVEYPDPPVKEAVGRLMDWHKKWSVTYGQHIVNSKQRNEAVFSVAKFSLEQGRRVLIIVRQLEHGEILRQMLESYFQSPMPIAYLQGGDSISVRKRVVKKFKKGVVQVIIGTAIFDEGIDIPEIDTVIIASAGKAKIKAIQRVGRGMRSSDSGHTLQVFDFWDTSTPTFKGHSRDRKKGYESMDIGAVERIKVEDFDVPLFSSREDDPDE